MNTPFYQKRLHTFEFPLEYYTELWKTKYPELTEDEFRDQTTLWYDTQREQKGNDYAKTLAPTITMQDMPITLDEQDKKRLLQQLLTLNPNKISSDSISHEILPDLHQRSNTFKLMRDLSRPILEAALHFQINNGDCPTAEALEAAGRLGDIGVHQRPVPALGEKDFTTDIALVLLDKDIALKPTERAELASLMVASSREQQRAIHDFEKEKNQFPHSMRHLSRQIEDEGKQAFYMHHKRYIQHVDLTASGENFPFFQKTRLQSVSHEMLRQHRSTPAIDKSIHLQKTIQLTALHHTIRETNPTLDSAYTHGMEALSHKQLLSDAAVKLMAGTMILHQHRENTHPVPVWNHWKATKTIKKNSKETR